MHVYAHHQFGQDVPVVPPEENEETLHVIQEALVWIANI